MNANRKRWNPLHPSPVKVEVDSQARCQFKIENMNVMWHRFAQRCVCVCARCDDNSMQQRRSRSCHHIRNGEMQTSTWMNEIDCGEGGEKLTKYVLVACATTYTNCYKTNKRWWRERETSKTRILFFFLILILCSFFLLLLLRCRCCRWHQTTAMTRCWCRRLPLSPSTPSMTEKAFHKSTIYLIQSVTLIWLVILSFSIQTLLYVRVQIHSSTPQHTHTHEANSTNDFVCISMWILMPYTFVSHKRFSFWHFRPLRDCVCVCSASYAMHGCSTWYERYVRRVQTCTS